MRRGGENTSVLAVLRREHIALGAIVLSIIVGLIVGSFNALRVQETERRSVLSQEGDATAMTFVQRESFGVVIAFESWARGGASERDVQIARAVLGQRLGVVTASGWRTFELTGDEYIASLAALDEVIRAIPDAEGAARQAYLDDASETVSSFTTEVRALSAIFERILAEQTNRLISERADAELSQGVFSLLALVLGTTLGAWILFDINRSYRESSNRLAAETERLEQARRRLDFRRELDNAARSWNEGVASDLEWAELRERIRTDLCRLVPGIEFDVGDLNPTPISARTVRARTAVDAADARLASDLSAALARAEEVVAVMRSRASIAEDFAARLQEDILTGLPNRSQLPALFDRVLERARGDRVAAIVLVNLDRFAEFNTSYSHREGDLLLIDVAERLTTACPDHEVVRMSADEFAIIGDFADADSARQLANTVSERLRFERRIGSEVAHVAATVSFAHSSFDDAQGDTLIEHATASLSNARAQASRPRISEFNPMTDAALLSALHDESALRSALRTGEFQMHFQPIVQLSTGRLAGVESLVRWNRPGRGLVPPLEFLPGIARAGLTVELGWQVIDQSLEAWSATCRAAASAGVDLDGCYVSINIDAEHLAIPTLSHYLVAAMSRLGLSPHGVAIEVTEHALLDGEVAIAQLRELRDHGMRIALDDFGTGYSSLSQATALPLDILKIDRAFLPGDELSEKSASLIRNIVSIASTLDVTVTAEGVETRHVADALSALGVHAAQGWLYSKALPPNELISWLADHAAARSLTP